MDRTRRSITATGLASLAGALPFAVRAQSSNTYRFSPVNQYGIELTARYWNPIIDYVSQKSGVKLELKIGRTSADTTAYVLANEVEFIFTNHMFSPEREQLGWRVLARRQTTPIHSQVVVLAESPIQKLEQLEGQSVAFPGPEATVAYKFSYGQMLRRHINVQVVFGGNMDGAFAQLASGKVQAAGTQSQLAEGWMKRENRKLRVLWQSEPLHEQTSKQCERPRWNFRPKPAGARCSPHLMPVSLEELLRLRSWIFDSCARHFEHSRGFER